MMIAPVIHVSWHPTARPSESVGAVRVEFRKIPFELRLEPLLEVITLLKTACAKADLFLLAHPSDQLQLTFMFRAILAFTVLVVPVSAEFLVCRPILLLTIDPLEVIRRQRRYNPRRMIGAYRNTRSLCILNICAISRRELFGLYHRFCSGGGSS